VVVDLPESTWPVMAMEMWIFTDMLAKNERHERFVEFLALID
jgi:hypothetical protein